MKRFAGDSLRWRRAVGLRLAAILCGIAPFLFTELTLRALGRGKPNLHVDPYVGFSERQKLFEQNAVGDTYEIVPARQGHFFPASFTAQKPKDEFRIFCIGDSTVQGNPWEPETSFSKWLEINLRAADSTRTWRVINCGGISYASYRMVPILDEILRYEPDLVIVHCSHNEFLEERSYESVKRMPSPLRRLRGPVAQLRLVNILRPPTTERLAMATNQTKFDSRPVLTAEVDALLDYRGGLELYHRDEAWMRCVVEHFEFNLRRMALLAHEAQTPLLLMNPACNLRNSPPFKAEHRAGITEQELDRWNDLWTEARNFYGSDPQRAVQLLSDAVTIDDQHAGLHYDLAKCHDVLRNFDKARAEYVRAKELDVCPLRILDSMNAIVMRIGRDTETPVVDVRGLFDRLSREQIPGNDWFADHVHPTIPGYQQIADELANELVRLGFVQPTDGWLARKEQRYNEHFDSLPPSYFTRGQERLRNLLLWANGRATKDPRVATGNKR